MKKSKFNVFIQYKGYYIGYNTLYETVILLVEKLYLLVKDNIENEYLSEIGLIHPQLKQELIDKKFYIENDIDELSIISKTISKTNNDSSIFEVVINPTINCNFNCWYCYEDHKDKSKIEQNDIRNIISLINNKIYNDNKVQLIKLQWFGGEPLLHYKDVMKPILTEVNKAIKETNKNLFSGITTNGFLINKEMLDFLWLNNHKFFQITLDGNRDRHNSIRYLYKGSNTYDKIIKNIILCIEKGFRVSLRLNLSEDTNLCVDDLLADFQNISENAKNLLWFSVHKVWQAPDEVEKTIESVVSQIREKGFNSSTYFSSPTTINSTCYADKTNSLVINPNGKIFKCTARDYTNENVEGVLLPNGEVEWNELHKKRIKLSALDYKECSICKILPICNAGCSQKKIENPNGFCPCNYDEDIKIKYAKNVLLEKIEGNN